MEFWNFLEFVLKNRKKFQPGSEVGEFWNFLEFVLKNRKIFQPGSEVVEFCDLHTHTTHTHTHTLPTHTLHTILTPQAHIYNS